MSHTTWTVRFAADPKDVLDYIAPCCPQDITDNIREEFAAAPSKFFTEDGLIDGEVAVNIVLEVVGEGMENGLIPEDDAVDLISDVRVFLDVPRVRDLSFELANPDVRS
jgi:hypothetical protein